MKKILYIIASLLMLAGCSLSAEQKDENKSVSGGTLQVNLGNSSRTVAPVINENITNYDVIAVGPNSEGFNIIGISDTTLVKNEIVEGAWTITINAKNSEDKVVATDTQAFLIEEGKTTTVSMKMTPPEGKGRLSFNLSWPENILTNVKFRATLKPANGETIIANFVLGATSASFTNNEMETGYYQLNAQLIDGDNYVWDLVETIRIVKDETTSASLVLTPENFGNESVKLGNLNVSISNNLENPLELTVTGNKSEIYPYEEMTVTAQASETPETYEWYLNGELLAGEKTESVIINGYNVKDKNRLVVIAIKGTSKSSKSVTFTLLNEDLKYDEMINVEGGQFLLPFNHGNSHVDHTVSNYSIGKYEVTYELWYSVYTWAINNGFNFQNAGTEGHNGASGAAPTPSKYEPVTMINWRDSIVWCNAYSSRMGLNPVYKNATGEVIKDSRDSNSVECDNVFPDWEANGYRLPTEAEFKYAQRGGKYSKGYKYSGSNNPGDIGWLIENSGNKTHNVGEKLPNELNIYDLSGNVYEMSYDYFGEYADFAGPYYNYKGVDKTQMRVQSGGAFHTSDYGMLLFDRAALYPNSAFNYTGLRVAQSNNGNVENLKYTDTVDVQGGTYNRTANIIHTVSDFSIGKYEVTYELWYSVHAWAINNGYNFENEGIEGNDGIPGVSPTLEARYEPVTSINWQDTLVWCNAYSDLNGLTPVYRNKLGGIIKDSRTSNASECHNVQPDWNANGYRLPTVAERDFVHIGGNLSKNYIYSGSNTITESGWYLDNSNGKTHTVGEKVANELGLYDLSGNVFEICYDYFGMMIPIEPGSYTNFTGPVDGYYRARIGGSWDDYQAGLKRFDKAMIDSLTIFSNTGFRVVKSKN